jgi:hypothetical protein
MGILVLGTTGRAHWVDTLRYPEPNSPDVYWRPRYVAQVGIGWRGQLQAWLAGANDRPGPLVAISELSMVCEGFHALLTKSETSVAIDFLYELDLSESSSDHERWYESPAMSVPP